MVTRVVEVPADRLVGWVERYGATHPGTRAVAEDGLVRLETDGAATASLVPLLPFVVDRASEPATDSSHLVAALARHAASPVRTALVLIRRGGFAVGVATGETVERSKVGTRYVQSRTAAGGWSQQRFARRRTGQAKELVGAAAAAWAELSPGAARPVILVTGGDRTLCSQVLAEDGMRDLRLLGSARHLDVPDPRLAVLQQAAARAQALVVTVREP